MSDDDKEKDPSGRLPKGGEEIEVPEDDEAILRRMLLMDDKTEADAKE